MKTSFLSLAMVGLLVAVSGAAPPAAPATSSFAPADDVAREIDFFLGRIEQSLTNAADYDEAKQLANKKFGNTLAVLSLAVGMHDTDSKLKDSSSAMIKAAQAIAKGSAKFEDTQKALAAFKAALAGQAPAGKPAQWEKVASMGQLMKQVPQINTGIMRAQPKMGDKAQADIAAGHAAALAVIGQAVMADTHEVKNPADTDKWYAMCAEMRDAAAAVNTGIRANNKEAVDAAMKRLHQRCIDCHAVFRKEEP
jgi:hypothetical protein